MLKLSQNVSSAKFIKSGGSIFHGDVLLNLGQYSSHTCVRKTLYRCVCYKQTYMKHVLGKGKFHS